MFNLIKMDLYRLFHSKAMRVGIIIAAIVAFVGMLFNLGVLALLKLAMEDSDPSSAEGMAFLFPIMSWLNGVDFADVVFTSTNSFSLFVACMVVASFIGAEQSCGYVKNVAGQLSNRGKMVISKYIVTCAVQLIILLVYTIIAVVFANMLFSSYITTYSIVELIEGLLLRFLLFCAVDAMLVFFCILTKSHAVAMVVGAIFSIGVTSLVYFAATGLLSMIKITLDVAKFMPDGINALINVASVGDVAVRAIIVSVVFIAIFLTGAVLLFQKRDVK